MTVSVLKTHFCKLPPKAVTCGDFKKFENERFMDFLKLTLNSQDVDYTKILDYCLNYAGIKSCSNKQKVHPWE